MKVDLGKVSATARVTLTLEVEVSSNWDADCSIAQVYEQAEREAKGAIRHLIENGERPCRFKIVGESSAIAVIIPKGGRLSDA